MKLSIILMAFLLTFVVFAEDKSSGCGMGWKVVKDNSLISSTTRSYTNSTFSSTIGMTLGTSGCGKHSIVNNSSIDRFYAEANFNELMVEMAMGQGQYLEGFAHALGCERSSHAIFFETVQKNYPQIYGNDTVTPMNMLDKTKTIMKTNAKLSESCGKVII